LSISFVMIALFFMELLLKISAACYSRFTVTGSYDNNKYTDSVEIEFTESCAEEEIARCEPERKSRVEGEEDLMVRECTVKYEKDRKLTENDIEITLDLDDDLEELAELEEEEVEGGEGERKRREAETPQEKEQGTPA